MTTTGDRSAAEVFKQHSQAMIAGELEAIAVDYSDDALFITPAGVLHGKEGVPRGLHETVRGAAPAALRRAHADPRR